MNSVWLIGASSMAQDYIKVLKELERDFTVVGRSEANAKACASSMQCEVISGGLEQFLSAHPTICSHAIVSVGVEALFQTSKKLLIYGVKNILIEKPGAMHKEEFEVLVDLATKQDANVFIAYNRRFYASTLKAKEIIENDGGVTSFNFEFTEWGHVIAPLEKAEGVKEKWFLGNSTHVVDMAFYLGGLPKELTVFTSGSLDWHPSSSIFAGAGISEKNALFSYQANWESAGRWSVEVLTKEHRLIFRPMEKLQIQKRGSIAQTFDETIDYDLDDNFKPGLYLQTKYFLENNFKEICTLEEQCDMINTYNKIANY
jgi:predicted dehydrogenase